MGRRIDYVHHTFDSKFSFSHEISSDFQKHKHDFMLTYAQECKKKLCSSNQKQAENVYVTLFRALSLTEYIYTRSVYCQEKHIQPCSECSAMLSVAKSVATNGYCQLASAYRSAFPLHTYKPDIARLRLLQMPLACIRLGSLKKGTSSWYLVEYVQGVDYVKFACFVNALQTTKASESLTIDKAHVKALLGLACSDRE